MVLETTNPVSVGRLDIGIRNVPFLGNGPIITMRASGNYMDNQVGQFTLNDFKGAADSLAAQGSAKQLENAGAIIHH